MRKPIALIILMAYLAAYIWLVTLVSSRLVNAHGLIQLLFYASAGIIWIFPLRRLFAWMNANTPPPE